MKKLLIILLLFPFILNGQVPGFNFKWDSTQGFDTISTKIYFINSLTSVGDLNHELLMYEGTSEYLEGKTKGKIVLYGVDTIPITCIPNNLNQADTHFFKWEEQELNADLTENKPFRITSIAHYAAPQSGNEGFYGAIIDTSTSTTITVCPSGCDYTEDNLQSAILDNAFFDTIVCFSATYTRPSTYLTVGKDQYVKCVGDCEIINSNTSYAMLTGTNARVEGFEIVQNSPQYTVFQNNRELIMSKMYIDRGSRLVFGADTDEYFEITKSYLSYDTALSARGLELKTTNFKVSENCFDTAFNAYVSMVTAVNVEGEISYNDFQQNDFALYTTSNFDSLKIIGNNFNSNNRTVLFDGSSYSSYLNFSSNTGICGGIGDDINNNRGYFNVTNNNISSDGIQPFIFIKNRGLNCTGNNITGIGSGDHIVMTSDTVVILNIANNTFNSSLTSSGAGAIFIGDSTDTPFAISGVYEKNEMYHGNLTETHGVQVYNHPEIPMRYNYAENARLAFIYKSEGLSHKDLGGIYGNVYKNGEILIKGADSCLIANNTGISDTVDIPLIYLLKKEGSGGCQGTVIRNNIFQRKNTSAMLGTFYIHSDSVTFDSDKNIIYSDNSLVNFQIQGVDYTFSEWQGLGNDLNSFNIDPLLDTLFRSSVEEINGNGESLDPPYDTILKITSTLDSIVLKKQFLKSSIGVNVIPLKEIDYYISDTLLSRWANKINNSIKIYQNSNDTIILGADTFLNWDIKTNNFIKEFSNDTIYYGVDTFEDKRLKYNTAASTANDE